MGDQGKMGVSDAEEHVALSRALVVALRFNGLSIPGGAEPDIGLQAPELLLLGELARGGAALLSATVAAVARRAAAPMEPPHTFPRERLHPRRPRVASAASVSRGGAVPARQQRDAQPRHAVVRPLPALATRAEATPRYARCARYSGRAETEWVAVGLVPRPLWDWH